MLKNIFSGRDVNMFFIPNKKLLHIRMKKDFSLLYISWRMFPRSELAD